jgi:hypothetical protein
MLINEVEIDTELLIVVALDEGAEHSLGPPCSFRARYPTSLDADRK